MRYFYGAAHEQFPPEDLLKQAVEAERAGFDGVGCSDHLQPWWEPGESGHAWVWLGAAGQTTERVALGTAVTPPGPRFHPVLIAQAWAAPLRRGAAQLRRPPLPDRRGNPSHPPESPPSDLRLRLRP